MATLIYRHEYMRRQLRKKLEYVTLLNTFADAIENLYVDEEDVDEFRAKIAKLEEEIDLLEVRIRNAAGRLALISNGHPDPDEGCD